MMSVAFIFCFPLLFPKTTGRIAAMIVKAFREAMKDGGDA